MSTDCDHPAENMAGFCALCGEDLHPEIAVEYDPAFAAEQQKASLFDIDYMKLAFRRAR